MLTKEYIFVLKKFQILHKLKKEDNLTSSSYLHLLDLSTLVEPNQMILAILMEQLQYGKAASVSINIVNLFVSKLCLCQAQQYLVPLLDRQKVWLWNVILDGPKLQ